MKKIDIKFKVSMKSLVHMKTIEKKKITGEKNHVTRTVGNCQTALSTFFA